MNGSIVEDDHSRGVKEYTCCLIDDGVRCTQTAGNASYSKRIQNTVGLRDLKLETDQSAYHTYICDFHKGIIQSARSVLKRKESDNEPTEDKSIPDINLDCLSLNTLRRYKRFFKVHTKPGINKTQLAESLTKHFKTIPVDEKEVIALFVYSVKTRANKLDYQPPGSSNVGQSSSSGFIPTANQDIHESFGSNSAHSSNNGRK